MAGRRKGGAARRLTVSLGPQAWELVEAEAGREGTSLSAAVDALIVRGASARAEQAGGDPAAQALEAAAAELRAAAAGLEDARRQMEIARKNIGKATQASEGALALLSWERKDVVALLADADRERAGREGRGADPYLEYWDGVGAGDVFGLYQRVGGALQADPATSLYRAMDQAMRRPPFSRAGAEELVGVDEAEWAALCGRGNDAAAVQSLAAGNHKKKSRGKRGGKGADVGGGAGGKEASG